MSNRENLINILVWGALAGTGGMVRFVAKSLQEPFTFTRAAVYFYALRLVGNVLISGFSGLMGALFISTFTKDNTWHLIAAGSFGYLGIEGLDYITQSLKKKFFPTV